MYLSGLVFSQINSNVERVFARFLKDGMVTIRFKEPAHELSLSKVRVLFILVAVVYYCLLLLVCRQTQYS